METLINLHLSDPGFGSQSEISTLGSLLTVSITTEVTRQFTLPISSKSLVLTSKVWNDPNYFLKLSLFRENDDTAARPESVEEQTFKS
jgi:hypothetical protein